jgi:antitoxin component YwqK of YwqJK toxin-antitoxin module
MDLELMEQIAFHKNGQLKSALYKVDEENGVIKCYEDNGRLSDVGRVKFKYFENRIVSLDILDNITFYKNGSIKCKVKYFFGDFDNYYCNQFYRNGKLAIKGVTRNSIAKVGAYYKKSGFKKFMNKQQLDKITKKHQEA